MNKYLYNKYSYAQDYYYSRDINQILLSQGRAYIDHIDYEHISKRIEYLQGYYSLHKSRNRLNIINHSYRMHINSPRYFYDDIKLDFIIDKWLTHKKRIHYEKCMNQNRNEVPKKKGANTLKMNLKRIHRNTKFIYQPILNEITFIRQQNQPTTQIILEMIPDDNKQSMALILRELEMSLHNKGSEHLINQVQFQQYLQFTRISMLKNINQRTLRANQISPPQTTVLKQRNSNEQQQKQEQLLQTIKSPQIKYPTFEHTKLKSPSITPRINRMINRTPLINNSPITSPRVNKLRTSNSTGRDDLLKDLVKDLWKQKFQHNKENVNNFITKVYGSSKINNANKIIKIRIKIK